MHQTERDQQSPERTVYELTEEGRRQVLAWLAEMLTTPRDEFPEFPAALSFVMLLAPRRRWPCWSAAPRCCATTWPASSATWRERSRTCRG